MPPVRRPQGDGTCFSIGSLAGEKPHRIHVAGKHCRSARLPPLVCQYFSDFGRHHIPAQLLIGPTVLGSRSRRCTKQHVSLPLLQALWQVLGLMARHGCLLQQRGQGSGAPTPPSSVRGSAAARGPAADVPGPAVELADVLTVGALVQTAGQCLQGTTTYVRKDERAAACVVSSAGAQGAQPHAISAADASRQ